MSSIIEIVSLNLYWKLVREHVCTGKQRTRLYVMLNRSLQFVLEMVTLPWVFWVEVSRILLSGHIQVSPEFEQN